MQACPAEHDAQRVEGQRIRRSELCRRLGDFHAPVALQPGDKAARLEGHRAGVRRFRRKRPVEQFDCLGMIAMVGRQDAEQEIGARRSGVGLQDIEAQGVGRTVVPLRQKPRGFIQTALFAVHGELKLVQREIAPLHRNWSQVCSFCFVSADNGSCCMRALAPAGGIQPTADIQVGKLETY